MRTVEAPLGALILGFLWLVGVPVASYLDALLKTTPETEGLTTVYAASGEGQAPGFQNWFIAFLKLNSWEMLLVSIGAVIGTKTWNKKVRIRVPF